MWLAKLQHTSVFVESGREFCQISTKFGFYRQINHGQFIIRRIKVWSATVRFYILDNQLKIRIEQEIKFISSSQS
jgi:phosphatidylserine decarboxylase